MVALSIPTRRRSRFTPGGFTFLLALLTLMLLGAATVDAQEELDARVDSTSIHQNESLTLTVQGTAELELSLGSIMNLRNLELPEPDLGDLTDSFEILDQRQSYSLRSINGEHTAEVTWTYQLLPRRSGSLTIPALSFKGARSAPIEVEVQPGSSPDQPPGERDAWVEAEVSKEQVFVQEQLVYTLRLYYHGNLIGGQLSQPEFDHALVEPMGEQRQSTEQIGNRRYQVVERRYLVYPERSGELELPAQRFTGRKRDAATGALRFLRAESEPLTVQVEPPPPTFPGQRWLAAESLVLDENWRPSPENLQVGDSITRELTLRTLGLQETALPRLDVEYPSELRAYPESPTIRSTINNGTVEASQSQRTVLIAVEPGTVTVPEVRLHWWDTINGQLREAVIPERTLDISPAPGSDTSTEPAPAIAITDDAEESDSPDPQPAPASQGPGTLTLWLMAAAVFFALAWLVTLWLLWRKRKSTRSRPEAAQSAAAPQIDIDRLKRYARHGHVETLRLLPAWVRERFGRPDVHTLKQARDYFADPDLNRALDALEAHHFSGGETEWKQGKEGKRFSAILERLNERGPQTDKDARTDGALPPFSRLT